MSHRRKNREMGLQQNEKLCASEDVMEKVNRQGKEQENKFVSHIG